MTKFYLRGEERHRKTIIDFIMGLALDKVWEISVGKEVKRRGLSANNLYWSWLSIIADETGNDAETVHEFCKHKFLNATQVEIGDEVAFVRLSTAKLSTLDFSDYMTKVSAWAGSDLGIYLPHPDDQHRRAA